MCATTILNKDGIHVGFKYRRSGFNCEYLLPYFTAEAPTSNKRPPPILAQKSCVGLIALELAPTVNYWFKG